MKTQKIIALLLLFAICIICFCACNPGQFQSYYKFPAMQKYSLEDVYNAAKEKYNLVNFVYEVGIEWHFEQGKIGTTFGLPFELVNANNVDVAINSFAGENGNYDTQMENVYFACYINIAQDVNGDYKFVFYNTNIIYDENIADTIGMSDYTSEISPEKYFQNAK